MVTWCSNWGHHRSFRVRITPETSNNYISGCISEIDIFSEFTLTLRIWNKCVFARYFVNLNSRQLISSRLRVILALAIIDGSEQQLSPFVFSLFTHPRICVSSPSRGLLWHLIFHLVKKLFNFQNFQVIREIFIGLVQKKWSRNRSKWNEKRNLPEVVGNVTRKYKIIYDWIKNITDFTLNRIRNND